MSSPYYLLTIREVREEVPGVKSFVLEPADEQQLTYMAGQYLTLVREQYGREARRSYSISSAPAPGESLMLTVKRLDATPLEWKRYGWSTKQPPHYVSVKPLPF